VDSVESFTAAQFKQSRLKEILSPTNFIHIPETSGSMHDLVKLNNQSVDLCRVMVKSVAYKEDL
jgi:hypothetical protein